MLIEVSEEQLATLRMLANYVLEDVATKPSLWRRKWVRMVNRTLQYLNTIEPVEEKPEEVREAIRKLADYGIPLGATWDDWNRWRDTVSVWLDSQRPQNTRQE